MKYGKKNKILQVMSVVLILLSIYGKVQAQTNNTEVGIFDDHEIQLNETVEIPIEIRNVDGLYAIDFEISFDPAVINFEDADPANQGIQPALGQFLDAGLVVYNEVDIQEGIIRFVMTQVNPSEPKSGNGIILVLYVVGQAEGETELTMQYLALSTREGVEIEAASINSTVKVSSTAAPVVATSIPVQDPGSMVLIPTLAPTPTPTQTPTSTPTNLPEPTKTQVPTQKIGDESLNDVDHEEIDQDIKEGFSLRENWWLFLIVFVPLLGFGGWYFLKNKQNK